MIKLLYRKSVAATVLLALTGILMLSISGCLVSEDKDLNTLIGRSDDTLRTIQPGDFMEYSVSGQLTIANNTQFFSEGTLNITWENATIPSPFGDPTQISVLKEVTTLTLTPSTFYEALRYIRQQPDGTIDVYAFNGRDQNEYYRVGPLDNDLGNIAPVSILHSDVKNTGADDINYKIAEGCETGQSCTTKILDIIERVTYDGDAEIQTDVGKFNTLVLRYDNGSFISAVNTIETLFDIRGACEFNKATFNGSYYVFPEVGIVRIDSNCNDGSASGHNYIAILTNTNISIPKP